MTPPRTRPTSSRARSRAPFTDGGAARATAPLAALAAALLLGCPAPQPAPEPADGGPLDALHAGDGGALDTAAGDGGGDAAPDVPVAPPAPLEAGEHTALALEGGALVLTRDGQPLVTLPPDAFELGVVPSLDPALNYDPYYLEPGVFLEDIYQPIDGLAWVRGETLEAQPVEGDDVEVPRPDRVFALRCEGGRVARVAARVDGDDRLELRVEAGPGLPAPLIRLHLHASPTEGYYGLGETFDTVEHRGTIRAMQFEPAEGESAYNEAHVPIPLLLGTSGWGIFVRSYLPGVFSPGVYADDEVRVTYGLGARWEEGLEVYLMTAAHPLDLTRHYYAITGAPKLPARWALGPWIWRDEIDGQAVVEEDLHAIREHDLATTGYWIDRPYASGVNSFDFLPAAYPNPGAMIATAHALGLRVALWHTPYVDPDDPATEALYQEAADAGYFAPEMKGVTAKWGPPIDLSNEAAHAWWRDHLTAYTDLGVEGFKLDYAEEIIPGALGKRLPWTFADGTDELTMQHRYQLLYHRVYRELLPADGGFLLVRASTWGDQAQGVIVWPGDIDANMARHGEEVTKDDGSTFAATGGLPAAVIAGSGLGPSGFPFFAADTGGYRHSPPDRETFARWFAQSAFTPAMQVGTNSNDLPWRFGPQAVLDQELLGWYRAFARVHLRLWPYVWTYAEQLATTGRAIQRPLGLTYPALGVHPNFTYLLGDALLVAPVVDHGATARDLTLPPGAWVDWWTGALTEVTEPTGQALTREAPLGTIPVYLRADTPVPMLRPTIDTLAPVADGDLIDSLATDPNPLWFRVAARGPGDAAFQVFDGATLQRTEASQPDDAPLTLTWTPGQTFDGPTVVEVIGAGQPPAQVALGGAALTERADLAALEAAESGWTWREDVGGTVLVKIPAPGGVATISW